MNKKKAELILIHFVSTIELKNQLTKIFLSVGGRSTWEPTREQVEQETSFGGECRSSVLQKEYLVGETYKLKGNKINQKLVSNLRLFKLDEDGR